MNPAVQEIIRRQSSALVPQPTALRPRLNRLPDVRAVLFDVYGTLFISASGDISTDSLLAGADAFCQALSAVGIRYTGPGSRGVERLHEEIRREHGRLRAAGIDFPEVDIREIWSRTLTSLAGEGLIARAERNSGRLEELAAHYETRSNPLWPMPGCLECLAALRDAGLFLGLISNAQFFTPYLFPALLGVGLEELGIRSDLRLLSYQHSWAKPGRYLYLKAAEALSRLDIPPQSALYIGNDMLKDVLPARQVGFRTGLFAGDRTSLRERKGDARVGGVEPDLVITELSQIPGCVGSRDAS